MNLPLLPGVFPASAETTAGKNVSARGFAGGPLALGDLAGLEDAAGNPVDAAMLAGAFRSLVDQLMGDGTAAVSDAAPALGRRTTSEADDLAAVLSSADELESDEAPQSASAQIWLVELEIVSRVAGVPELPNAATSPHPNQADGASPKSGNQDDAVSLLESTPSSLLSEAALPVAPTIPVEVVAIAPPTIGGTTSVEPLVVKDASTESSTGKGNEQVPGSRFPVPGSGSGSPSGSPSGSASSSGSGPNSVSVPEAAGRGSVKEASAEPRVRAAQGLPPTPVKQETSMPAVTSQRATANATPSEAEIRQLPLSTRVVQDGSLQIGTAGSGSGFPVQRSGVAKPEGATQKADPGILNRNVPLHEYPGPTEIGRAVEAGTRNAQLLQAFMSQHEASMSHAVGASSPERADDTTPKPVTTTSTTTEGRVPLPATASAFNEFPDGRPQSGRQPESHLPLARPIVADVKALDPLPVMLGAHELRLAHASPPSSPTLLVTANAVTPSSLPDETSSQIVQAIRLQVTRGGGEATIRLEPKHFGELSITVRVDQGQVNARLQAESPVVREYLQSHQNLLRESLAEQQLTLGKFEVAEPADSSRGERRSPDDRAFSGDRQPQRRRQPPETPFEPFEVVA